VARKKRKWAKNVSGYILGGAVTSSLAGAATAGIGSVLLMNAPAGAVTASAAATAAVAAAVEVGILPVRIPQLARRQTRARWGRIHGLPGAVLWGADIGALYTTWFTFGGSWLVIILAVGSRNLFSGVVLFGAFWLGRSLSILLGPSMMSDANGTTETLDAIAVEYITARRVHVVALSVALILLVDLLL
jgi:hypothetical protein